jgi:hypothetical protein
VPPTRIIKASFSFRYFVPTQITPAQSKMGNISANLFRVGRSARNRAHVADTTPNVAERLPRGACAQYVGVNLIRVGGACLTHLLLPPKVSTSAAPSTRNIGVKIFGLFRHTGLPYIELTRPIDFREHSVSISKRKDPASPLRAWSRLGSSAPQFTHQLPYQLAARPSSGCSMWNFAVGQGRGLGAAQGSRSNSPRARTICGGVSHVFVSP